MGKDRALARVFLGRGGGRGCGPVEEDPDFGVRQALEGSRWARTSPVRREWEVRGVRTCRIWALDARLHSSAPCPHL